MEGVTPSQATEVQIKTPSSPSASGVFNPGDGRVGVHDVAVGSCKLVTQIALIRLQASSLSIQHNTNQNLRFCHVSVRVSVRVISCMGLCLGLCGGLGGVCVCVLVLVLGLLLIWMCV